MFNISERENFLLKECRAFQKENRKVYIYGSGEAGRLFFRFLSSHQIPVDGFCVDDEYYSQGMECCGLPVFPIGRLTAESFRGGVKQAFIIAFMSRKKRRFENSRHAVYIEADPLSLDGSFYGIDYAFVERHMDVLSELYESLGDEKSRQCMTAYFSQKVSGRMEYLEPLVDGNKYYDTELVSLKDVIWMADCGAYDGDSFRAFCCSYEKDAGRPYSGKAYLLEPDRKNYAELVRAYSGCDNVMPLNIGAWDRKAVLCFEGGCGTAGRVVEAGGTSIAADCIDSLLSVHGTGYINMDIEGSELNALKGARMTIQKFHPILAVCIYHKKEDLITIPQYIKSLYSGYRLYLRAYERYSHDLVLYAVPGFSGIVP